MNDNPLSSNGSVSRLRTLATTNITARPTRIPPPAAITKSRATTPYATVAAVAVAVRRATSAVASLSSDSPSRIVTIRRGRPIRRPIAVAATASGGATTAPIANEAAHGRSGTSQCAMTATPSVVNTTRPTESSRITRLLALKSTSEVPSAAEYSNGGSSPTRTTSGRSSTFGTNGR
jgi:hypothetical protein